MLKTNGISPPKYSTCQKHAETRRDVYGSNTAENRDVMEDTRKGGTSYNVPTQSRALQSTPVKSHQIIITMHNYNYTRIILEAFIIYIRCNQTNKNCCNCNEERKNK